MDYGKVLLVVCLTLFLVVGLNAAIYAMLTRGKEIGQIDLFRKAAQRAWRPWGAEEDALNELSRQVEDFKRKKAASPEDQEYSGK